MSRVLLDTNILVYMFDRSEEAKQRRAVSLLEALQPQHEAVVSTQVLGEFFQVVTRKLAAPLSTDEALALLGDFGEAWTVAPITAEVVMLAARAVGEHGLSYWDAQLWAVAMLQDIRCILSEDLQDGRSIAGVRILNPLREDFDVKLLR